MSRFLGSVRVRITGAVALIFGITLSLAAVGLVRQVEAALRHDVQVRNDTVTGALTQLLGSGRVAPEVFASNATALAEELGSVADDRQAVQEGITESYIYATGPAVGAMNDGDSLLDRFRQTLTGTPTPLFGKPVPEEVTPDRFAISQANVETPQGRLVLNVASPLAGINRTVEQVSNALVVAVPLMVLAVGGMTWFMTGRALRPVSSITGRVQEITGSTLHERVPVSTGDDEIAELARTMNQMLDRLEGASERQRRFVSDASHELRSPVASIKAQLETALLQQSAGEWGSPGEWEEVARTVLAEDERLEGLVANLLTLARIEEGQRPPAVEVDLDEVVHEQASRRARVPVDRSGVVAGRVHGVPGELTSVVRNLLDNAVRHAGSRVRITLRTVGPVVRLSVEDDGPGVAPADREQVFQRFTRLEEGRSRDAGGSGLGLALSQRVVAAHGGRIFIETSELGGASFVVELPALPDPDADPLPVEHVFDSVGGRGVQQP